MELFILLALSSYGQFKRCVHEPLLRECGHRARNLMDHSMGFLVTRCTDKEHLVAAPGARCPSPSPPTESGAESESSLNSLLNARGRAERMFETTTTDPNWNPSNYESGSYSSSAASYANRSGVFLLFAILAPAAATLCITSFITITLFAH